jgi:hypothetical protein
LHNISDRLPIHVPTNIRKYIFSENDLLYYQASPIYDPNNLSVQQNVFRYSCTDCIHYSNIYHVTEMLNSFDCFIRFLTVLSIILIFQFYLSNCFKKFNTFFYQGFHGFFDFHNCVNNDNKRESIHKYPINLLPFLLRLLKFLHPLLQVVVNDLPLPERHHCNFFFDRTNFAIQLTKFCALYFQYLFCYLRQRFFYTGVTF